MKAFVEKSLALLGLRIELIGRFLTLLLVWCTCSLINEDTRLPTQSERFILLAFAWALTRDGSSERIFRIVYAWESVFLKKKRLENFGIVIQTIEAVYTIIIGILVWFATIWVFIPWLYAFPSGLLILLIWVSIYALFLKDAEFSMVASIIMWVFIYLWVSSE